MIDSQPEDELLSFPYTQYHPHFYQSSSAPNHIQPQQNPISMFKQPQVYGNPRFANPISVAPSSSHYTPSTAPNQMAFPNQLPNPLGAYPAMASPLSAHPLSVPQSNSAYTTAPPTTANYFKHHHSSSEGTISLLNPRAPPMFMDQYTQSQEIDNNSNRSRTNSTVSSHHGYAPSLPSTVPVHAEGTKPRRRRGTTSKRSLEEQIIDSNIPTATSIGQIPPQRSGISVGLLSMPLVNGMGSSQMAGPTLPLSLPEPPLATATPSNPAALKGESVSRPKKKSKYTAAQDNLILRLKKDGRSWHEISETAKCGNSIAARNRYQVLIGQQGGGAVIWDSEDSARLKEMLEDGERTKWRFIANELSRMRSKKASAEACQRKIKELFEENPASFGIILNPPMATMPQFGGYGGGNMISPSGNEFHDLMGNSQPQHFDGNGMINPFYKR